MPVKKGSEEGGFGKTGPVIRAAGEKCKGVETNQSTEAYYEKRGKVICGGDERRCTRLGKNRGAGKKKGGNFTEPGNGRRFADYGVTCEKGRGRCINVGRGG